VTAEDILPHLEAVRRRSRGYYQACCPAHDDRTPSLSIREGERGVLLKCWAGCELTAIIGKLGLEVKDLFYDSLLDPRQRREAMQRRAKDQAEQRAAGRARGRKADLLRHAEYLVQSARGMTIEAWTPAQLDKRLNRLADAYDVLREEHHDQR